MSDYDYHVKVVLSGDDTEGKAYLVTNFCKSYYNVEYKHIIGLDFHGKDINVLGKRMKLNVWELLVDERFKRHAPNFYRGALGAILIFDNAKPDFRVELDDTIQMIIEHVGDIPITLLTFNQNKKEFQAVSGVDTMLTADNYISTSFPELSSKSIQNPEDVFIKLAEYIIKRSETSPPPRRAKRPRIRTEFIINKLLKLRLESSRTNIYVGGRLFKQCKFLLLDIPIAKVRNYDEIDSIDEVAERLDRSMELGRKEKYHISPDIEFWGHCSNLQVWYENNYDTRILHSNLAFPLLRALEKAGDRLAKKVFKEEIALRLASGYPSVVQYLINENYLKYLDDEEKDSLLEDGNFIRNLTKWYTDVNDIPKWLSKRIKKKLKYISAE